MARLPERMVTGVAFAAARRLLTVLMLWVAATALWGTPAAQADSPFTFILTADMRNFAGAGAYDTCRFFLGACQGIAGAGPGAFMIVPGDLDPTAGVGWTISKTLGASYPWYPVVGNHELPGAGSEATSGANMAWLRGYNYDANGVGVPPDIVRSGPTGCPTTTFSFDYENAHFAVLNEYCDVGGDTATDGDVPDHLYNWLVADLDATTKPFVFVVGHEPAYPQPDADNGRLRHVGDSLDGHPGNRDRFWSLLAARKVTAYLCGHTHNYSAVWINGVWQIDVGHARGDGDTGAASTFLRVTVGRERITYQTFRDTGGTTCDQYTMTQSWTTPGTTAVTIGTFAATTASQAPGAWLLPATAGAMLVLLRWRGRLQRR